MRSLLYSATAQKSGKPVKSERVELSCPDKVQREGMDAARVLYFTVNIMRVTGAEQERFVNNAISRRL